MSVIVLYASNPDQVASASSIEAQVGTPVMNLMIFSGLALPEIGVDDDDDIQTDEVLVKLGHTVSAIHSAVTQVGLASISNDESAFVFATDGEHLEVDKDTQELQLRVHTAVMGDDTVLHRFSYQIVAYITKALSQISGAIQVPRAILDLSNMAKTEIEALFRITANRVEVIPPPAGAPPGSFTGEKLIPVATGKIQNVTLASGPNGNSFMEYLIDGCPFNIPLRVVVELTSRLDGLSAVQIAGPRPVVLTKLTPAVGGVNFAVIKTPVA